MNTNTLKQISNPLLKWYYQNARILPWRDNPMPYYVWISEIMLQQTRVEAVKPYFIRFIESLSDVKSLACVDDEKLMKLWEGLGYYNRARNLKKAAQIIVEQYNGELPAQYDKLCELPGIGPYTAGAIASIAFHLPVPAVDGNVLRVISRVLGSKKNISELKVKQEMQQKIQEMLPEDVSGFNQALMELGAIICIPNGAPKCDICPLNEICNANQRGIQLKIPIKSKKNARKVENLTVLIIQYHDKIGIRKRIQKGVLFDLWELPNVNKKLTMQQIETQLKEWGITPLSIRSQSNAKHIFTHIEWHMNAYYIETYDVENINLFEWVTIQQLSQDYALPTAFKKLLK
ncbi:A/G-specific adenine glycosylase [Paludicola sp. MB14-C6]|uniref:A/G-specific adenine glycosylase n=1 Tax=Paludihabitans sp. MB14-C6 TaxID=3070656 RepID=UPI0027DC2401|nr:A/G-specific adenine glycosylase [Paludicola sp. MB14-C6]WMJ23315.1 A/G-specific adenine glycosylase [Paludicola sp. MB14-C6]